jgi:putative redox protein
MAIIHASIGTEHYGTVLTSASNTYVADEPLSAGGGDKGFSPSELLASALATCTCVTLRMYADHKGWPLTGVKVKVEFARDSEHNVSNITRDISLEGDLSAEQHARLLGVANSCYIHKTLSNPINIRTSLVS